MNKKRFKYEYGLIWNENGEKFDVNECEGRRLVCDKLNEQQTTINLLLEELINAQQQGYVIGFLHKNEYCNLIPKELDDE